jgi:hypothetical protein
LKFPLLPLYERGRPSQVLHFVKRLDLSSPKVGDRGDFQELITIRAVEDHEAK